MYDLNKPWGQGTINAVKKASPLGAPLSNTLPSVPSPGDPIGPMGVAPPGKGTQLKQQLGGTLINEGVKNAFAPQESDPSELFTESDTGLNVPTIEANAQAIGEAEAMEGAASQAAAEAGAEEGAGFVATEGGLNVLANEAAGEAASEAAAEAGAEGAAGSFAPLAGAAINVAKGKYGKAAGNAVGGVAGSYFGPLGTMVGSQIGGYIGGLTGYASGTTNVQAGGKDGATLAPATKAPQNQLPITAPAPQNTSFANTQFNELNKAYGAMQSGGKGGAQASIPNSPPRANSLGNWVPVANQPNQGVPVPKPAYVAPMPWEQVSPPRTGNNNLQF